MSQATQPNATQSNGNTQLEDYAMGETPSPKPRFIPDAPRGRTYRRTSGHWGTNIEGKATWIPSSPNMTEPHMTGYKQMNSLRSVRNMRSMRRFAPTFSRNNRKKANKMRTMKPRCIIKRRTFKKINPNRKN